MTERKPNGYWQNPENIISSVEDVIIENGLDYERVPSGYTLDKLGYHGLHSAIGKNYPGGFPGLRKDWGEDKDSIRMENNYYKKWGNMKGELEVMIEELGGRFPVTRDFRISRRNTLLSAIMKHHGGLTKVREKTGYGGRKPPKHWKNWDNVKYEVTIMYKKLKRFPVTNDFKGLNKESLLRSIYEHHGDLGKVREMLGQEGVVPSEKERLKQLLEGYIEKDQ